MNKKLVLIDGHSILNRAFYGVPELTNAQGLRTNAIYGFLNILFKILDEEKPDYLAVAFDMHAPTFRHKMYDAYKGTRKPMPQELKEQIPVMKELLKAMNVVIMEMEGLEADDILGTLARKAERDGIDVSLVSGDRDLLQISTNKIKIRIPKTKMGRTEIEDYYQDDVKKAYQVTPAQFIELKALMGDTADNIPGVPRVGEKTAIALMTEYGSIENIYAHLEDISKNSIRESLRNNRELADLSLALATIKTDCELELDYDEAKAECFFTKEAYGLFKKLEFKNYLTRFDDENKSEDTKLVYNIAGSFEQFADKLKQAEKTGNCGLVIVTENRTVKGAAISFESNNSTKTENWFYRLKSQKPGQLSLFENMEVENTEAEIGVWCEDEKSKFKDALTVLSRSAKIATFDIKPQYCCLDTDTTDNYFDILIAAYLLNPLKSDYDAEAVASEYLGISIKGKTEIFGKTKTDEALSAALTNAPDKCAEYFCSISYTALKAKNVLEDRLKETGMDKLMKEIEMPLSLVLHDMEKVGVEVRRDELRAYGDALTGRICELEKSIHEQAGVDFNINSPKQLGEVLFETMKLPGGKKTKTGYSTAADVLEKLAQDYPIVNDILEYRGLTKLKSTYADGLAAYIEDDRRIHTNFNQTITATGRISSTEPNLQNIPMRMELGRLIRKVFVPGEGYELTDADYSQIELRVLAHMSGDEQLIAAYRTEQDIHRITASQVFHVPFEEVTSLQRRNAKAVNFGIVYGISSFGLSQDLSISKKEAAEYIEQYFATYPGVKSFLDRLVSDAKKNGYAVTMFGRRRPIPELSSSNFMQRSFGERVAMNSPIQGTAADIIKIAMIKVWRELKAKGLKSRLILQVHDELVIETYAEEADIVKKILEDNMKSAAELDATLEIDMHSGKNWYEAK